MGYKVDDHVQWTTTDPEDTAALIIVHGTVVEVHADGRLLVIQPDGFLDSLQYKGYEDVELLPPTYADLKAENNRLRDKLANLDTDYDNLRRWYDEAVKSNNALSEQIHNLHQKNRKLYEEDSPAKAGVVVTQVYDGDGDPWQYNPESGKFEMCGGSSCGRKTLNEIADEFKIAGVVQQREE